MRIPTRAPVDFLCASALLILLLSGCAKEPPESKTARSPPAAAPSASQAAPSTAPAVDPLPPLAHESALPEDVRTELNESFTGDLEEMVKRRRVRVGVSYNRTLYFIDKGRQRGVAYEYGKLMEDVLNKRRKTGKLKVTFWFVPLPGNQLLPALVDGKVDLVMAHLTATPERRKSVDFTNPTREDVNEIVVTGAGAPAISSVDDLAGKEVFVRKSSSYYQSLLALSDRLKAAGKPAVDIRAAPENLADDDLLEMVNGGLIKITVVDNYLADFWKSVFKKLTVHDAVAVRTGGSLAVAIRKHSPQLADGLNAIIAKYGLGTAFGEMMEKRYLQSTTFVKNATSAAGRRKFMTMVGLFKKYGDRYQIDHLLMVAQGYQESGLDQSARSHVGAIGVMQVMPATARDMKVGDVSLLEPNIHAGVKYIRWVENEYYKDEPMDALNRGLFAFASYNAGAGRIQRLRGEAEKRGLDPNVWFGNVEQVVSERIGRETVTYVGNIYKYYVAYRLVEEEQQRRAVLKQPLGGPSGSTK
jgi:membrane-bound lytic murein transglycosylase MltF